MNVEERRDLVTAIDNARKSKLYNIARHDNERAGAAARLEQQLLSQLRNSELIRG